MARLNVHIVPRGSSQVLNIQSTLEDRIRKAQRSDKRLMKIRKQTGENKAPDFRIDNKGILWYKDRICVPQIGDFRQIIMDEAHNSAYSIHLGSTKMYMDLKQKYLSKEQGRTSEASRVVATLTHPSLEMGRGRNGFCSGFAQDPERT